MPATIAHILNHTHWDREWFLTAIYTSQWIPGLIDVLDEIAAGNPGYRYFLDGQTLVIEDLLALSPSYESTVTKLCNNSNLTIGPYYCQPDWQLTGGEALLRNMAYGQVDMACYNNPGAVGWLVDTFGHISQSPQIHRLFGIDSVYVWRGVPQMQPYFLWQGEDGSQLFTVNLFGGYRNLYGVTYAPEIAIQRLQTEIDKLTPYYPSADILLFDGYDLETHPEDPIRFFEQQQAKIPENIHLNASSPQDFIEEVRPKVPTLPTIEGELNSGKYGATFPGTLSTRTHLKIMSRDCETLLYQVCEPLATLASIKGRSYPTQQYETWGRILLQNAVHDCICGVSIDQVHEKMVINYQRIFNLLKQELYEVVDVILSGFEPGLYAISTNPFPHQGWQVVGDQLIHLKTQGIGVWPPEQYVPIENPDTPVRTYTWHNEHYRATVQRDGTVRIDEAVLGRIVVSQEKGDAYTAESGAVLGVCQPTNRMRIIQESDYHCVISIPYQAAWEGIQVNATVCLILDQSPLIRWQIELDTYGTDFRVDMVFETAQTGQVYAGMPLDTVIRPFADEDLLPRHLDKKLENVLLGQREIGKVQTFPFHDFVAIVGKKSTVAVLAKGLHAYQADESGEITIQLRRSVEWLTRPDLETRVGDAGPFFYIPDGRCERLVIHELAVAFTPFDVNDPLFYALNTGFQNPPLIAETTGNGNQTRWQFMTENLPLSSLQRLRGSILARFFNPTWQSQLLSHPYQQIDISGRPEGIINVVPSKRIVTLDVNVPLTPPSHPILAETRLVFEPKWRVGPNNGLPDPEIIQQLKENVSRNQKALDEIQEQLERAVGNRRYKLQHQVYVLERELLEYRLSIRLNEIKLAKPPVESLFEIDQEVADIGWQLNQLRIKRRIYDYIVQTIE